jgi:hypothetical protein
MNNNTVRKYLKSRSFRTVASIKLNVASEESILYNDLNNKMKVACKTLSKLASDSRVPIAVAIDGLSNALLEIVQVPPDLADGQQPTYALVVNQLDDVVVSLGVTSTDQNGLFEGKSYSGNETDDTQVQLAKILSDNIKESVDMGTRLAKLATESKLKSDDISGMVSTVKNPDATRHVTGMATGPRIIVSTPAGDFALGGGLPVPLKFPVSDHNLDNCIIQSLGANGKMLLITHRSEQLELDGVPPFNSEEMEVHVKTNSVEMQLLQFIHAAKVKFDLVVTESEHLVSKRRIKSLVEIKNQQELIKTVFEKLSELKDNF